jgi:hypothetical protein
MEVLYGYTVLREKDSDDKKWAIVRIEVRYEENPGKASQYIHVVEYHASRNMAVYWATMLNEGRESEESVQQKMAEAHSHDKH